MKRWTWVETVERVAAPELVALMGPCGSATVPAATGRVMGKADAASWGADHVWVRWDSGASAGCTKPVAVARLRVRRVG